MRPLELDFVKQSRRANLLGWLLLLAGAVLLAAAIGWGETVLKPRSEQIGLRLATLQHAMLGKQRQAGLSGNDKELAAEWIRAMSVASDLNQPWDRLLSTLEKNEGRDVSLLTLEPDAVKHALALTAEARNFRAMLDFYRRLQAQTILQEVTLHAHQINEQDTERPIRFRIISQWASTP